jgi:hypothetical protein
MRVEASIRCNFTLHDEKRITILAEDRPILELRVIPTNQLLKKIDVRSSGREFCWILKGAEHSLALDPVRVKLVEGCHWYDQRFWDNLGGSIGGRSFFCPGQSFAKELLALSDGSAIEPGFSAAWLEVTNLVHEALRVPRCISVVQHYDTQRTFERFRIVSDYVVLPRQCQIEEKKEQKRAVVSNSASAGAGDSLFQASANQSSQPE